MSGDGRIRCAVEAALGAGATFVRALAGGCIADTRLVSLADGREVVCKHDAGASGALEIEGWMLRTLRERSPIRAPEVLSCSASLLVMERLEGRAGLADAGAQREFAEALVALHACSGPTFGLERDTLIGPLHQPNNECQSWIEFFRDHRLLHMAGEALRAGALPVRTHEVMRRLADRLGGLLEEPEAPSLLHGDAWTGNVLSLPGRFTGVIDPAIYRGHPEIELAFLTLFGTVGEPFFARYGEIRPIRPGFFKRRRDLYNLYPLLVHARLFDPPGGGSYAHQTHAIAARFV